MSLSLQHHNRFADISLGHLLGGASSIFFPQFFLGFAGIQVAKFGPPGPHTNLVPTMQKVPGGDVVLIEDTRHHASQFYRLFSLYAHRLSGMNQTSDRGGMDSGKEKARDGSI